MSNTKDNHRPFLNRVPRPDRVKTMLQAAEQRVEQLQILYRASKELEAAEQSSTQEAAE